MRLSLTSSFCVALVLLCRVSPSLSDFTDDLEGSGYDLDASGSGSGSVEWSGDDDLPKDVKVIEVYPDNLPASSAKTWPTDEDSIILANSKSLLESGEIHDAVIAGGVIGALFVAVVAAVLIYKWQKKDDGYSLGQQRDSEV